MGRSGRLLDPCYYFPLSQISASTILDSSVRVCVCAFNSERPGLEICFDILQSDDKVKQASTSCTHDLLCGHEPFRIFFPWIGCTAWCGIAAHQEHGQSACSPRGRSLHLAGEQSLYHPSHHVVGSLARSSRTTLCLLWLRGAEEYIMLDEYFT